MSDWRYRYVLAIMLWVVGCVEPTPAPSRSAVGARPPELPCQPEPFEAPGPVTVAASSGLGDLWKELIGRLGGRCPLGDECEAAAPGWAFRVLPVALRPSSEPAGSWDGSNAELALLVPAKLEAGRTPFAADVLDLLPILSEPGKGVKVIGYSLEQRGTEEQRTLRVLPGSCRVTYRAEAYDEPARIELDTETALASRQLARLSDIESVRVENGLVQLSGPPREAADPVPPLSEDDLRRLWIAVERQCDCKPGQLVNGHECSGAFVSLDPADPDESFTGAVVALPPCLRDSHLGQVLIEADTLLKELAGGFRLDSSGPLPVPEGHRTVHDYLVEAVDNGYEPERVGAWTRYWLDTRLGDLRPEEHEDEKQLDVGHYHLSLGVEVTKSFAPIGAAQADATHPCERSSAAGQPEPQLAFCREVNAGWQSYREAYPVLREADRAARVIQVLAWVKQTHPDAWQRLRLDDLAPHTVLTPMAVPNLATSTVVVDEQGKAHTSISYGGVVFKEARVVRAPATALPDAMGPSPRQVVHELLVAPSDYDIHLAFRSDGIGIVNPVRGPPRNPIGLVLEQQPGKTGLISATDDAVHPASGFGSLESSPSEYVYVNGLIDDGRNFGLGTNGKAPAALVNEGGGKMKVVPMPEPKSPSKSWPTTAPRPPRVPSNAQGGERDQRNPPDQRGALSAAPLPQADAGVVSVPASEAEAENEPVDNQMLTQATGDAPAKGEGGIRIGRVTPVRIGSNAARHTSSQKLLHVVLPNATQAAPRAAVQVSLDGSQALRTPLIMQRHEATLQVGFVELPVADDGSFDRTRLLEAWPDGHPALLLPRRTLQGATSLARRLSDAATRPVFVASSPDADTLAIYRSALAVRPGSLKRALVSGPNVPQLASWRATALASNVPPGPGVVAIGDDAEAVSFVARLGRLGRLRGKIVLLAAPGVSSELWDVLLLHHDQLRFVVWVADGDEAQHLRSALGNAADGNLITWLSERPTHAVVLLGGSS